jgi:preprotein translocase subunit SecA
LSGAVVGVKIKAVGRKRVFLRMLNAIKNLFDDNARDIRRLQKTVDIINGIEPEINVLSDEALRAKTSEFKERLAQGETLDDLLPEAFAVAREASWRVLGMRPYDVQLMGGIVLHQGRIAEMILSGMPVPVSLIAMQTA